jgi:hypothetical protein
MNGNNDCVPNYYVKFNIGNIVELYRGRIFIHVRPSYEWAVSDQDRSMHISLWALVAHSSFIEGSHMAKNTASGLSHFMFQN